MSEYNFVVRVADRCGVLAMYKCGNHPDTAKTLYDLLKTSLGHGFGVDILDDLDDEMGPLQEDHLRYRDEDAEFYEF
jgi:hypothetical protein